MTSNQCKRLQQIQHLSAFGTECHKSVQSLLSELNWDEKQVLNCEPLVLCPYDSRHRMSCQSIGKHLEKCELKANGLTNEEIETLPPSSAFYYSESADISPVVIDKQIEDTILGEPIGDGFRGNRSRIELSSEQRLALYSHVIQTNRKTRDESTIDDKQSEQSLKSLTIDLFSDVREKLDTNPDKQKQEVVDRLEMIAMNRDMKRRRQSYKSSKNVHIRGKSYTEILRKVIDNHCQTLGANQTSHSDANTKTSESHRQRHKTHKTNETKDNYKSEHKYSKHRHESHETHRHRKH